ncbi:MAG: amidase family protein, partial [Alphaproteobacteria bacterium]
MTLFELSALDAATGIAAGNFSSEEFVQSCLDRIADTDDQVQAWTHLDAEYALAQAKAADAFRQSGLPVGPLFGVPVAIKDIFDTADMPTECGTPLYAGRTPTVDSTVVALLRQFGA